MTLADFFQLINNSPSLTLFYFLAVPLMTFLAWQFSKGESHESPWKYVFSTGLYLACIPGILSIALSVYLFLFERRGIMQTDIFIQIVPILSMLLTIWLTKRAVDLDRIPGFGRLSSLFWMIGLVLLVMYLLDRTHIFAVAFMHMKLIYVLAFLIILLLVARICWRKLLGV